MPAACQVQAATGERLPADCGHSTGKLRHQTGLADTGLACDENHAWFAICRTTECLVEPIELGPAPDKNRARDPAAHPADDGRRPPMRQRSRRRDHVQAPMRDAASDGEPRQAGIAGPCRSAARPATAGRRVEHAAGATRRHAANHPRDRPRGPGGSSVSSCSSWSPIRKSDTCHDATKRWEPEIGSNLSSRRKVTSSGKPCLRRAHSRETRSGAR